MSNRYVSFAILQGSANGRVDPKFTAKEIEKTKKEITKYIKSKEGNVEYDKKTKLFTVYFNDKASQKKIEDEISFMFSEIMINGLRGSGYRDPTFYVTIEKSHLKKEEEDIDNSIEVERGGKFPASIEDIVVPLIYAMNSRLPDKEKISHVGLVKNGPQNQIVITLGDYEKLKSGKKTQKKSSTRKTPKKTTKTSPKKKKEDENVHYTIHMKIKGDNAKIRSKFDSYVHKLLKKHLGKIEYAELEIYSASEIQIVIYRGRHSATTVIRKMNDFYYELKETVSEEFGGKVSNIALSN